MKYLYDLHYVQVYPRLKIASSSPFRLSVFIQRCLSIWWYVINPLLSDWLVLVLPSGELPRAILTNLWCHTLLIWLTFLLSTLNLCFHIVYGALLLISPLVFNIFEFLAWCKDHHRIFRRRKLHWLECIFRNNDIIEKSNFQIKI